MFYSGVINDIRASEEGGQTVIIQDRRSEKVRHCLGSDVVKKYDDGPLDDQFDWPLGSW